MKLDLRLAMQDQWSSFLLKCKFVKVLFSVLHVLAPTKLCYSVLERKRILLYLALLFKCVLHQRSFPTNLYSFTVSIFAGSAGM